MRNKPISVLLVLLTVILPARVLEGSSFDAATQDTALVEMRQPFEPKRVLDLLYGSRPDSALTVLRAQQAMTPRDPFVLLLKAKVLRERLNDEDNNKELIRRSTEPIHAVIDSAIAISNEALARDVKDIRHYYFRGYGWLSKAQLYVLARSYWTAGRMAARGKEDLETYLEKYPDDADAQGILGAYYYFADAIPGLVKFVAKLLFIPSGDREKGLDMIRYAATHDGVFSTDWQFVLAAIDLVFEGNFEQGTDEFIDLLEKYPYYTRLAEPIAVVAPLYPSRVNELRSTAGSALDTHLTLGDGYVDWSLVKRIRLVNAFTDAYFGRPEQAAEDFTKLIDDPPRYPDWVVPIALLNRGYLRQKTGRTDEAKKDFGTVRSTTRSTYYHRVAASMLETIDKPLGTFDLADLDFVRAIYDGDYDDAAMRIERYRAKYGENALIDFYTGDLAARMGDISSARAAYARALEREEFGGDQIYQLYSATRLAELLGQERRYSEARNELKRAREYCYANYLLRYLLESRERFYELVEKGRIASEPNLLTPHPATNPRP